MNPKDFFGELRRRNIYRVAVAYAVVAWLIIQVATATFPYLEIPPWAVRLIIALVAFGFPIALVLAWAYELTPEGIKRTEEVPPQPEPVRRRGVQRLNALIIAVLACAVAFLIYQRIRSNDSAAGTLEKSIAVLPFENFSDDKENAFFADGIQDDILTSLAKIHDLKVISRTSVMPYRGAKKDNLPQIAQALGVVNVLEGSVRRGGNRVVVSVQLIDARNDRHLWAKRYDRPLEDSLGLQGELAAEIANELRATLSPEEKGRVETKPTENAEAYVLYLKARGYEANPDRLFEDFKLAERLYSEALQHDPSFALAHARLAATLARIYHWFDPTDERKIQIRKSAEKALQLKPDLGEGHLALGLYYYWTEANYDRALEQFRIASAALPNDSEIGYVSAAIRRRQGKWKDNLELLRKSETVDPGNANVASEIAFTCSFLRDWPQAAKMYDRVVSLAPESANFKIARGYVDFWANGNTARIKSALAAIPSGVDPSGLVTRARWDVAMIERDFAAADQAMASFPLDVFQSDGMPMPKSFFRGCTALARGDTGAAQVQFTSALPAFEAAVQQAPATGLRHANLGLLFSYLGRKEDAVREVRRAIELEPESKDAVVAPWMQGFLAMVYARAGDMDSALPILERVLAAPFPVDNTNCCVTINDLRNRWQWDPVRNDPRFQKLLEK
ncbi:MAG TPA: tetratricopeptide repeat protein [Chthoniobacterales bacterium]|nr:tetratricopeptide repeat protein [Chthoniobacterales bacterium]